MKINSRLALLALISLTFHTVLLAQFDDITTKLTREPAEAQFIYDDLHHFIKAFAMLDENSDTVAVLQAEYIDKGTPGLKIFIEKYGLPPAKLAKRIKKYSDKYGTLDELPPLLLAEEKSNREAYVKLKSFIPGVVFPPTYYLVETYRGIGSGSVEGSLISVEKWNKPIDHKSTMLIHELVHFQQVMHVGYDKYKALFGPEKNLLGLCIREGTAEFFTDLVTGRITQDEALEYVTSHEKELWKEFQIEMAGSETGDWMWQKPADPEQPYHVGYAMGYMIVKAYYEQSDDKAQAVTDILSVTDYPEFLNKSGYAEKFQPISD